MGYRPCIKGVLLSTGDELNKAKLLTIVDDLRNSKVPLYATSGTYRWMIGHNIDCHEIGWPDETDKETAIDLIKNNKVDLVVNIPKNLQESELFNDYQIRLNAVSFDKMLLTDSLKTVAYFKSMNLKISNVSELENFLA